MRDEPVAAPRLATHVVGEEDAGERADVVLGRRILALSRRLARNLARDGKLRIDGRRSPPSTRVSVGARLELELELGPEHAHAGTELEQLEVLALTDRFVYVRKPAGVHAVALTPSQPGVLATAVAARFPECADASVDPREGGAVHRLDLPTSGVVAFARSREIWLQARAGFADERVTKHYLAVSICSDDDWPPPLPEGGLRGWIEAGSAHAFAESLAPIVDIDPADRLACAPIRIRAALGRDGPQRSCVSLDGRRASTVIQPLARSNGYVLSHLLLETGCRHQARVHLAWIGWPIRGDTAYGALEARNGETHGLPAERMRPSSIALHAFALDLSAVFADEQVVLARPPAGFWPP